MSSTKFEVEVYDETKNTYKFQVKTVDGEELPAMVDPSIISGYANKRLFEGNPPEDVKVTVTVQVPE
jgi:hypothetical protein